MRRLVPLCLLFGCGPSADTLAIELTEEEVEQLCDRYSRPARTVSCPDGGSFELPPTDDQACVDSLLDLPEACDVTLGSVRACYDAIRGEDPCTPVTSLPDACEWQIAPNCVN